MLTRVDRDHLARDCRGVNEIAHGRGDIVRRNGPFQRRAGGLALELAGRLVGRGQGRAGPMALTRMRGARSWAMVRVSHHRPALDRL